LDRLADEISLMLTILEEKRDAFPIGSHWNPFHDNCSGPIICAVELVQECQSCIWTVLTLSNNQLPGTPREERRSDFRCFGAMAIIAGSRRPTRSGLL